MPFAYVTLKLVRKFILPIFFVFLLLAIPVSVFAKDPECWTKHMVRQMADCSKAFLECNNPCGAILDESTRYGCFDSCSKASKLCNEKASADYKACVAAGNQTQIQEEVKQVKPSPQPSQLDQIAVEEPEEIRPFFENFAKENPLFIGGWFKAVADYLSFGEAVFQFYAFADEALFGRDDREIAEEEKAQKEKRLERMLKEAEQKAEQMYNLGPDLRGENSLNDEALWQYGVDPKDLMERKPKINEADIEQVRKQAWQPDSPYRADIIKGQVQIKLMGSNEWTDLKQGDKIPLGATIFTGMDSTTILSLRDEGVVEVLPFTQIYMSTYGLEQAAKTGKTTTDIGLRTGEIEVNVGRGVYTSSLQVHTPTAAAGVRGTHFWVKHDKDKNVTTVGVYEGMVEVKARNGKTSVIIPNKDKPGVIAIAQKFSPVRFGIAGFVLLAIIGGVILILKRKFASKGFGKKKK